MFKQSNDEINFNIELAKEYIFKACGQEAKGFRAPVFSIPETRKDILEYYKITLNMIQA